MTKRERERYARLLNRLQGVGFSFDAIDKLLRMEKTLRSWGEHECNGTIQRDEDGTPYRYFETRGGDMIRERWATRDMEGGALKRLAALVKEHDGVEFYIQGDPRGASLYLYLPSELDGRDIDTCYNTAGICCCIG